jgi:hypothetical protein
MSLPYFVVFAFTLFFNDRMSTDDKVCLVLKILDKGSTTLDIYIFPILSSSLFFIYLRRYSYRDAIEHLVCYLTL